jgi:hypothetical protein
MYDLLDGSHCIRNSRCRKEFKELHEEEKYRYDAACCSDFEIDYGVSTFTKQVSERSMALSPPRSCRL